ncbi:MAG: type II secretion system pilot lipoprotein GspS-beta [Vibrionaceae bacterium]
MRSIVLKYRLGFVVLFSVLIAACAGRDQKSVAEAFASQRAEMLGQIIPVNMNGYNLIKARARGPNIELTLLYTGIQEIIQPKKLVESLAYGYCQDQEIVSVMRQGVSYKLSFRDERGRVIHEGDVTSANCI